MQQFNQKRDPKDKRPLLVMASDEGRFGRTGEVHRALVSTRIPTDYRSPAGETVRLCLCCRRARLGQDELFDSAVC